MMRCVVAHHRHDVLDLALIVEQHLRFGGLEIDRATLAARLVQGGKQLVQVCTRQRGLMASVSGLASPGQPGPDLVIGQAGMRAEHRRIKRYLPILPVALISMSQTIASRSTLGFSEQMPFDSFSGSIGTTRRGNKPNCRVPAPRGQAPCPV